jgi:hypothetical protein
MFYLTPTKYRLFLSIIHPYLQTELLPMNEVGYSSSTVMAPVGQVVTHVMQRIQSSGLTGTDFFESG